ncbi:hypothetical protein DXG01_001169 [Tephrocybe rancida]|nr:hypothetical protein DXG01_001169 [Tephrocybe rancida]
MLTRDDYVFFWKPTETDGWLGQWYPSPFTTTITISGSEREVSFTSAEQYMMTLKALLFNDYAVAEEILAVHETHGGAMGEIKGLGRQVQGFEDSVWVAHRSEIVLQGNMLKFSQNEDLKELLLDTESKKLVEASPNDRIWGVGFSEKRALGNKEEWGLNLLGMALEETRSRLRGRRRMASTASPSSNKPLSYAERARKAQNIRSPISHVPPPTPPTTSQPATPQKPKPPPKDAPIGLQESPSATRAHASSDLATQALNIVAAHSPPTSNVWSKRLAHATASVTAPEHDSFIVQNNATAPIDEQSWPEVGKALEDHSNDPPPSSSAHHSPTASPRKCSVPFALSVQPPTNPPNPLASKSKWVPIPAEELQATADALNPPSSRHPSHPRRAQKHTSSPSHPTPASSSSHSRLPSTSHSLQSSPLFPRGRRLPDDSFPARFPPDTAHPHVPHTTASSRPRSPPLTVQPHLAPPPQPIPVYAPKHSPSPRAPAHLPLPTAHDPFAVRYFPTSPYQSWYGTPNPAYWGGSLPASGSHSPAYPPLHPHPNVHLNGSAYPAPQYQLTRRWGQDQEQEPLTQTHVPPPPALSNPVTVSSFSYAPSLISLPTHTFGLASSRSPSPLPPQPLHEEPKPFQQFSIGVSEGEDTYSHPKGKRSRKTTLSVVESGCDASHAKENESKSTTASRLSFGTIHSDSHGEDDSPPEPEPEPVSTLSPISLSPPHNTSLSPPYPPSSHLPSSYSPTRPVPSASSHVMQTEHNPSEPEHTEPPSHTSRIATDPPQSSPRQLTRLLEQLALSSSSSALPSSIPSAEEEENESTAFEVQDFGFGFGARSPQDGVQPPPPPPQPQQFGQGNANREYAYAEAAYQRQQRNGNGGSGSGHASPHWEPQPRHNKRHSNHNNNYAPTPSAPRYTHLQHQHHNPTSPPAAFYTPSYTPQLPYTQPYYAPHQNGGQGGQNQSRRGARGAARGHSRNPSSNGGGGGGYPPAHQLRGYNPAPTFEGQGGYYGLGMGMQGFVPNGLGYNGVGMGGVGMGGVGVGVGGAGVGGGGITDTTKWLLLGQLEYYLSPQNMAQDFFLRQRLDTQGYVPIPLISSFNRVLRLTEDANLVREVLLSSSAVEVRGGWVRMRDPTWRAFVLPGAMVSVFEEEGSGQGGERGVVGWTNGDGHQEEGGHAGAQGERGEGEKREEVNGETQEAHDEEETYEEEEEDDEDDVVFVLTREDN